MRLLRLWIGLFYIQSGIHVISSDSSRLQMRVVMFFSLAFCDYLKIEYFFRLVSPYVIPKNTITESEMLIHVIPKNTITESEMLIHANTVHT